MTRRKRYSKVCKLASSNRKTSQAVGQRSSKSLGNWDHPSPRHEKTRLLGVCTVCSIVVLKFIFASRDPSLSAKKNSLQSSPLRPVPPLLIPMPRNPPPTFKSRRNSEMRPLLPSTPQFLEMLPTRMTYSYLEKRLKMSSNAKRKSIRSSCVGRSEKTFTSSLRSTRLLAFTKTHQAVKATATVRKGKRRTRARGKKRDG
jgi:hypothetical protein